MQALGPRLWVEMTKRLCRLGVPLWQRGSQMGRREQTLGPQAPSLRNPLAGALSNDSQSQTGWLPPRPPAGHLPLSVSPLDLARPQLSVPLLLLLLLFFFPLLFMASPTAYGSFQARNQIGGTAASLCHSHSHAGSEPRLRPTPQLTAMPDP